MKAQTYNDTQLDAISRAVYYDTVNAAIAAFGQIAQPDPELLHAYAQALDAASCGFDDADEADPDVPAGMRQTTPYNDDLINEASRDLYVRCLDHVQEYLQGKTPMNIERLNAYSHLADAAACGFHEDEDDD